MNIITRNLGNQDGKAEPAVQRGVLPAERGGDQQQQQRVQSGRGYLALVQAHRRGRIAN